MANIKKLEKPLEAKPDGGEPHNTWIHEYCLADFADVTKKRDAMTKARMWGILCGLGVMLGAQAQAEAERSAE